METILRAMELRDAGAVAGLSRELGYERSEDDIRAWIVDAGANGSERAAYVACVDERVLGWIEVSMVRHLQSEAHVLIGGLVVTEGARGTGVGRLLCGQAETWAREQKATVVRVTSRSTRDRAHGFYRGLGYEDVKTSLVFEKKID